MTRRTGGSSSRPEKGNKPRSPWFGLNEGRTYEDNPDDNAKLVEKRINDMLNNNYTTMKTLDSYNDVIKGPHFNKTIDHFVDNIKKVKNDKELKQITLILLMMLKRFGNKGFLDERTTISWEEFQKRKERIDPLLASIQTMKDPKSKSILGHLKNILIQLTYNIYEKKLIELNELIKKVEAAIVTWSDSLRIVETIFGNLPRSTNKATLSPKIEEFRVTVKQFLIFHKTLNTFKDGSRNYKIIMEKAIMNDPVQTPDKVLEQFKKQYNRLILRDAQLNKAVRMRYNEIQKMLPDSIPNYPKSSKLTPSPPTQS
jgi:hypothetical protein